MRTSWIICMLAMLLALPAFAAVDEVVLKHSEASMLLAGTIDIASDGSVDGYAIDHEEKVPDFVRATIGREVKGWRFEPVLVDGQPAPARTKMNLRVVARLLEGNFSVILAGAYFGEPSEDDAGQPSPRSRLRPPPYPSMGGEGTVYVVLKVGRGGKVEDSVVEQINLRTTGSEGQMKKLRRDFADATIRAARRWTFKPPTVGEAADDDHWSVRVPVDFMLYGREVAYGEWQEYVPGPRQRAPWIEYEASFSPDALAGGGVYPVGAGVKLLTPLSGEG